MKTITITLADDQAETLKKWLYYKKMTGSLHPDDDPFDAMGLQVARELSRMEAAQLQGRGKRRREVREISRQQVKAHTGELVALVQAYHGLLEKLLEDRANLQPALAKMKPAIERYQDQVIDGNGESC